MDDNERSRRPYKAFFSTGLLIAGLAFANNIRFTLPFELLIPSPLSQRTLSSRPCRYNGPSFLKKLTLGYRSASLSEAKQSKYAATLRPKTQRRNRKWERMIHELKMFHEEKGHSLVTAEDVEENPNLSELYLWTQSVRRNYIHQALESRPRRTAATNPLKTKRPRNLQPDKLKQLEELDFCWDVQNFLWEKRYNELLEYYQEHGHSRVPANHPGGLGIFVRNCRREYRNFEQGEPSTLTVDRLNKLFAVDFVWYRSREEAWEYRYQQLQEFYQKHGHSNVPERYAKNPALGKWCTNQRTHYRRLYEGEMSSLTEERIQLLEDLGFIWNYRKYRYDCMVERMVTYYREHGHLRIPTNDNSNFDLRMWIALQRYYYHRRLRDLEEDGESSVPLTEERIKAIESAIPDFRWRARGNNGPSSKDWAKLFNEMRKKGLQPGMPGKRHWFDGVNPFSVDVKNTWSEEDLLALWNQDDDDDDDDGGFGTWSN